MRARSRPAILSVLLVAAVSIGVFASSSLALQGVSDDTDELLAEVRPFESLRTSGGVTLKDGQRARTYRLDFVAVYDTGGEPQVEPIPDVIIKQVTNYPALSDSPNFVGPAALPFGSTELALRVTLAGNCFEPDKGGSFLLRAEGAECARAVLALDGNAFNVTSLLGLVEARLSPASGDATTGRLVATAAFRDPQYPFPIASLGERSHTTLIMGDFGGRTGVRRVTFSG